MLQLAQIVLLLLLEGPSKGFLLLLTNINLLSGQLGLGTSSEEERQLIRITQLFCTNSLLAG